jgi:hypothetical protein
VQMRFTAPRGAPDGWVMVQPCEETAVPAIR